MIALSLSTFLITHLVKVFMFLCTFSDQLAEIFESATSTRAILAVGDRSWCGIRDETDELAGSITGDCATITSHLLHTNVAKERN